MRYFISFFMTAGFFILATAQATYQDSSFNGTGIFRANHAGGNDVPSIMLTRPNGKSLEIGDSFFGLRNPVDPWNPETSKPTVVQFDSNGLPDTTFGEDGLVFLDIQGVTGAFLQPDGKLLLTGYGFGWGDLVLRLMEDGSIDTDFGNNGIAGNQFGIYWGYWNAVTAQPDGKIILGGSGGLSTDPPGFTHNFLLTRLNANGTLDSGFGTDGFVYSDSLTASNEIYAITMGPGGSIVAAGSIGNDRETLVARYLENGLPDSSFGQNGVVVVQPDPFVEEVASRVLVEADGKIILAGPHNYSYSDWGFVRRLTSDGADDNTFQSIITYGPVTGLSGLTDGTVLVSSFKNFSFFYPDSGELTILRYLPSGFVDPDFGGTTYLPSYIYRMNIGLGVQADGKIIIGGSKRDAFFRPDYCLMRFSAAALLDTGYGAEGFAIRNVGSTVFTAYTVLTDAQKQILVGGNAGDGFVTRLSANGALDPTFAGVGWRALSIDNESAQSLIALKEDESILSACGVYNYLILKQLLPDGATDTSFGQYQGNTSIPINSDGMVRVSAIVRQSSGEVLVLGGMINDDLSVGKAAIARFTANGWVDSSFAVDGVLLTSPNTGAYEVNAGAVLPDDKILVAGNYHAYVGATPQTFLIRYLPDGSLDPTFGTNGIVTSPFSAALVFQTKAMAIQPDGRIVLCGSTGSGSSKNTAVGRLTPNGTKDNTFSGDGVAWISTGPFIETANTLAVQNDGKIVVAATYTNANDINESDPVLLRFKDNGTLDSTFSENGYIVTALPGDNEPNAMVITPDGNYVVAGFSENDYLVIKYLRELIVDLVNTPVDKNTLLVYPNPVHGQVVLEYVLPSSGEVTLEMFDLNGKLVHTFFRNEQKSQGENIAVMYIPAAVVPGAYVLRLQTALGSTGIRIVVE
jgi:uncharacterized delta-60 repeat protein